MHGAPFLTHNECARHPFFAAIRALGASDKNFWPLVPGILSEEKIVATQWSGMLGHVDMLNDMSDDEAAQARKMRAIGRFAGGLAHDFNNLLMVTLWNLSLLERSLESEGEAHRYAKTAMAGAQQCADLLRELLVVAAEQPRQLELIDLREVMPALVERMAQLVGPDIEVTSHIEDCSMFIQADPAQFETALLAVVANAKEAMPEGGSLSVGCSLQGNSAAAMDENVAIRVSDTGEGMSDEVVERAFEPFFTTRRPSRGRGLGLSKVYGFVNQTKGKVRIRSEVSTGTTVAITLPSQNF